MNDEQKERETALMKKALRAEMRLKREALSDEAAAESGRRITESVLDSEWYRQARSVFIYVSVGKEPDTRALILTALRDGKQVSVPRCREKPAMDAVRISSPDGLRPGALGIPEPPEDGPLAESIDLAVVPCVSVSPRGDRLGHGGGYYDAFLAARPCRTICLCHKELICENIPADSRDVLVDAYTCGEGVILCDRDC